MSHTLQCLGAGAAALVLFLGWAWLASWTADNLGHKALIAVVAGPIVFVAGAVLMGTALSRR